MLLAIDIGNTNITFGLFKNCGRLYSKGPVKQWRMETVSHLSKESILKKIRALGIKKEEIDNIAVASVVPGIDKKMAVCILGAFNKKVFFVTGKNSGAKILYDRPNEVGTDRLCDAVAAYEFFGGPAIIIDFGTATTFDCINSNGDYLGGVIAPGPLISAEALYNRTAKLPYVTMKSKNKVIGKTTIESIRSGLYFGYIGLTKEILLRLVKELRNKPVVIATGGLAGTIVPKIKEVKLTVPELTLEGIRLIFEKNKC